MLINYRPGYVERARLTWDEIHAINPSAIVTWITGWGANGPYAELPAYDLFVVGVGGLMSITGEPDGPPQRPGINLIDLSRRHARAGGHAPGVARARAHR